MINVRLQAVSAAGCPASFPIAIDLGPWRLHDDLVSSLVPLLELAGALSLSVSCFEPWQFHVELTGTLVLLSTGCCCSFLTCPEPWCLS